MAGCSSCKFHESELHYHPDSEPKFSCTYSCNFGNNKENAKWWKDNSKRTKEQGLDDMECHEYTDVAKALDRMNDIAKSMLDELKKM